MRNVLFVSVNDTTRAPLMKGLMGQQLLEHHIEGVGIESAALMPAAIGLPMDKFSLEELHRRGISPGDHVGRHVTQIGDLDRFDTIITTGAMVSQKLRALCPTLSAEVIILNDDFCGIPNPHGRDPDAYKACATAIDVSLADFLDAQQEATM